MRFHQIILLTATISSFVSTDATAQLPIGRFVDPKPLTVTDDGDDNPNISFNGLELFFSSRHRTGSHGDHDLYSFSRSSIDEPFGNLSHLASISGPGTDGHPSISADRLTLYFSSERSGGEGGRDIYQATRSAIGESFDNATNLGPAINGPGTDGHPSISEDGLTLFFFRDSDLYVANRASPAEEFGNVSSLGPVVNSGFADASLSLSTNGLSLFFHSGRPGIKTDFRDIFVAARDSIDEAFGIPVNVDDFSVGSEINSSFAGSCCANGPDISKDWPAAGAKLYFRTQEGIHEATWQPERLASVPISAGEAYVQNFDEALPVDGEAGSLPTGWTTIANSASIKSETTKAFPHHRSVEQLSVFHAGEPEDSDRALAIGVPSASRSGPQAPAPLIQLLSEVSDGDATGLQLQFDLETWDAATRRPATPGVAAFNVSLDIDTGGGFQELHDFGDIRIGELTPPDGDFLNGNEDAHRATFDEAFDAELPEGSTLRIRWEVPDFEISQGWVFGIDDVQLNLFGSLTDAFDCNGDGILDVLDANCATALSLDSTLSAANLIKGDADGDGHVQFSDFLILLSNFSMPGVYTDGDFDSDGEVQFSDFLIQSKNFGQSAVAAAAVPEPSSTVLALCGLVGLATRRRRN